MYLTRTPRDSDVAPDLGNVGLKQCFSSCQLLPTAKKINLVSSDQDLKKKVGGNLNFLDKEIHLLFKIIKYLKF